MEFLSSLAIEANNFGTSTGTQWRQTTEQGAFEISSPVDGKHIANVYKASSEDYQHVIITAKQAFLIWRKLTAPHRGDIVRQIGNQLRENKQALGELVSYEMGKSLQEGLGEVQEMIDICDFAVGLSRQLNGSTLHSERPFHRMYDQYHPLGVVGVISAFNFPVAVWSWNAMIAAICGNVTVWKPSEKTPLTAIACQHIIKQVLIDNQLPEGIFSLIIGEPELIGEDMLEDRNLPLVSVTGSTRVGRHAGQKIAARFGKSILELGGNNAIILTPEADLKLAVPGIVFGAVGTAGQRCTSTRRVIVHESIYDQVKSILIKAYQGLRIGSPLDENNHVGPLIDQGAVQAFSHAIKSVTNEGGNLLCGGDVLSGENYQSGCYVQPAIVEAENHYQTVQHETFAPILYLIKYQGGVEQAIAIQNDVLQGLSSAIFSNNMRECEIFLSHWGSDCGIANVNIGTSGAEIGGAFGGEKETGGGRESGSDAWKAYMRRQTNTINFSTELPLAQGIKFDL
ncbi:aldehyde dehydrogenase [Thalassotalea insulae]|uniref:aldehyde dehydrogenase (NAD(+)) n=1 Tax=Thalassotalea insulae TaxID=2056778 RepID=A0ABQ6GWV7_9GAMM|nr:aldehyde dehydrogenase family protein [Thalassotalea insulae]GLX80426.1 aldehyde dehydrogenase [Thalassotalea insulae]